MLLCYFSAAAWVTAWVDAPDGVGIGEITLAWVSDMSMWLPTSLIIVPLAAFDLLRFSHRFVLPACQLRSQIRQLAAGNQVDLIDKNEEAMWQDTLEEFNRLREELLTLRDGSVQAAPAEKPRAAPRPAAQLIEPIEIPVA